MNPQQCSICKNGKIQNNFIIQHTCVEATKVLGLSTNNVSCRCGVTLCLCKEEGENTIHALPKRSEPKSPRWYPSDDDLFNAFIIEAFSCMGSSSIVVVVLLSLLIELLWALWKKSKDPTKRYVHFDLIHNHPSREFLPILVTMDSLDASTPPLFPISSGLLLVT